MAVNVGVNLEPNTRKVEAALARIQAQAKGVDFGSGARSVEKLSRPLGKITGQATEFQKSLEASNARVLAFGASVAVINKLSQAFGALVENTIRVEATFAKINTILGGTQKQLEQFGNGIFAVAQKTATSFDQVADGALELARQGLSVEESLSRVETSLKLVRVAGIDSQQAVAGLTAAIKGFEGAGLNVAQIADKLAEVDTKFAVSTEDLINGLERASASARVAGVSFDELLGVITTVQERTQRGGAVIGNAFKTIFARLGRTDTLAALEDLGINVLDVEGNVRSAIPLFQELAVELNKLGLKSVEAGEIIQKVAGVRQRDILISLVEDLNSGQSQFAKSLQVSAGAAGALDRKNTQLNDTLEALINNLTVGAQKLSSVVGELGFTDAAKDILKVFSSVVSGITDLLQGDSIGSKFAQSIVKGIGGVLTGPGLALISAIFVKLFVDLAKFGASSLKSLLGINKAAEAQKSLQQSVLQTLLQNESIQREILALEGNKVAQEQLLLKIYNQQAAALARVQKAAATVAPGLFGAGLRGGAKGVAPKGRASDGYVAAEARDVSRGVGGAPSSSKVVSIPNFAFGGGKRGTMVANTSEYVVPNYAGGGDAIFNQDMVRSMGLPSGAKKINASSGFIPNFVKRQAAPIQDRRFALITPDKNLGKFAVGKSKTGKSYQFPILGYNDAQIKGRETKDYIKSVGKFGVGLANLEAKKISGGRPAATKINELGNRGSVSSLAGVIYEAAVSSILKSPQYDLSQTATFDFVGSAARNDIAKLYPGISDQARFIEAKISGNTRIYNSMANKMEKFGAGGKGVSKAGLGELQKSRVAGPSRKAVSAEFNRRSAGGYIPNFARGALDEAVAREQAAGLPINQIRINQSGKLRNSQNPQGLAVTNTRDEPTGRIPNFAKRGTAGATESVDKFSNAALGASTALFFLSSAFSGAESGLGKFISEVSLAASLLSGLSLLKGPLENVGAKLSSFGTELATFRSPRTGGIMRGSEGKLRGARGGLGRGIAGVGRALPGIGTAVAVGAVITPLILELTKTTTGFEKLNEELSGVDLSALQLGTPEAVKTFLNKLNEDINSSVATQKSAEELGAREGQTFDQRVNELVQELKNVPEAAKDAGKGGDFLRKTVALLGQSETQKLIDKSRLTPEQTVSKKVEEKAAETGFVGFLNKASDAIFGGVDREAASRSLAEDAKARPGLLFDSEEFKKAVVEFSKSSKKVTDSFLTEAEKEVGSGKFGEGAKTGVTVRQKLTEQLTAGKFAARGFDREIIDPKGRTKTVAGEKTEIRQKELELAKAVGTTEKVDLENKIALLEFSVEKRKEEFAITENFVKSLSDSAVFSEDAFNFVKERVKAGGDLLSIQQDLETMGFVINGQAKKDLDLAIEKLLIKRQELKDKLQEVKLQQEINNLQKPQGFADGFSKGLGQVKEDIDFFKDELGENIPLQFSDNLGSAMQDAVSGAKDLDDALSDAGRNFLGFIRDAFLQQAADQFTNTLFSGGPTGVFGGAGGGGQKNIFSSIGGLFGGGEASGAAGGAASGGAASGGAAASGGGLFSKVGGFFGDLFGGGKKGGGALGSSPTNPLFVQDVANAIGGGVTSGAEKALEGITGKEGEGGIGSEISGYFSNIGDSLKNTLGDVFGNLTDTFKNLFSGQGGIGGIFSSLLGGGAGGGGLSGIIGSLFGSLGGGSGILGIASSFFGFNKGGIVPTIRGYANGGSVGSTDTVPAMLTPGEFVVKKSAVDKYGTDFLSSLNKGMLPMQGFQNGGAVSPVASEAGSNALGGGEITNNSDFTFNIQDGKVSQEGGQGSSENQREFASRIRSAVTTVIQEESRSGGTLNYLYKS